MTLYLPDPSQVTLQLSAHNVDGTPKTSLTSAKVRVYHMNGATEVEDLAAQDMTQVGSTNTWRYIWAPGTLGVDVYYAAYALEDNDGAQFSDFETLTVMDVAEGAVLSDVQDDVVDLGTDLADVASDVTFIKKIEQNRKRILNNQLIIYENDGTTEWLRWDLFDVNGIPTNGVQVYDTVPV